MTTVDVIHKRFIAHLLLPHDLAERVLHTAGFRVLEMSEDAVEVLIHRHIECVPADMLVCVNELEYTKCSNHYSTGPHTIWDSFGIEYNFDPPCWLYILPRDYTIHSARRYSFYGKGMKARITTGGTYHINQVVSELDIKNVCARVRRCPSCLKSITLKITGSEIVVI